MPNGFARARAKERGIRASARERVPPGARSSACSTKQLDLRNVLPSQRFAGTRNLRRSIRAEIVFLQDPVRFGQVACRVVIDPHL